MSLLPCRPCDSLSRSRRLEPAPVLIRMFPEELRMRRQFSPRRTLFLRSGLDIEFPLRLGHLTEHGAPVDQDGAIVDYVDKRSPELHRTPPATFMSGKVRAGHAGPPMTRTTPNTAFVVIIYQVWEKYNTL